MRAFSVMMLSGGRGWQCSPEVVADDLVVRVHILILGRIDRATGPASTPNAATSSSHGDFHFLHSIVSCQVRFKSIKAFSAEQVPGVNEIIATDPSYQGVDGGKSKKSELRA